jgi:hypothetical protein
MNFCIPMTLHGLRTLLEILVNLHIVAIIVVNLTKTPKADRTGAVIPAFGSVYRLIEIFAGLITPLAKR